MQEFESIGSVQVLSCNRSAMRAEEAKSSKPAWSKLYFTLVFNFVIIYLFIYLF